MRGRTYYLQLRNHRDIQVSLVLTPAAYVDYVPTETNVAYRVQNGVAEQEIRAWCEGKLAPIFRAVPREVVFRGYIACLVRN